MNGEIVAWLVRLALLGLGGLATALALARLARRGRERPAPVALPRAALIAAAAALLLAPRLLRPLLPSDPRPAHPWNLVPVGAGLLLALVALFLLAPRPRWFLPRSQRPGLGYALAAYAAALPALLGLLLVLDAAAGSPRHELLAGFSDLPPVPAAWTLLLAVAVMPALEEAAFRGWLFAGLAADPRTGPTAALAISSLVFGFSHPQPLWLPATALGLLLGWVHWRVGDLRAPILVHALHNAGVFVLTSLI